MKNLDVKLSSQKVKSVDSKETIKRLEKQFRREKKIADACKGISGCILGITLPLGLLGGMGGPGGAVIGGIAMASGIAVSAPLLGVSYIAHVRSKNISGKLNNLRRRLDPNAYFEKILDEEERILKGYESHAAGQFSQKDEGLNFEKLSKEAQEKLPEQKQLINILEKAHSLAKQCGKEQTVARLADLARVKVPDTVGTIGLLGIGTSLLGAVTTAEVFGADNPVVAGITAAALLTIGGSLLRHYVKETNKSVTAEKSLGLLQQFVQNSRHVTN